MSKEERPEKLNPQRECPLKALPYTVCQGKQKKQQVPTEKKKCRVCVACSEPLQKTTYIRCCECAKSNVVLCHECFSAGAEIGAHERGHAYEVKNSRACPVFDNEGEQWGCEMDLEMLSAFKDYQDGSWEPQGIDMTKANAAEAVHRHIDECFLNGHVGGYVLKDKRWPVLKEVDIAQKIVEDKRANADTLVAEPTELQPQKDVVGNDPDTGSAAQVYIEHDGRVVFGPQVNVFSDDCTIFKKPPSHAEPEFGNKHAKIDQVPSTDVRPNTKDVGTAAGLDDRCPMQLFKRTRSAAKVNKPDTSMRYSGDLTTEQVQRLRAEHPHRFFHNYPSHSLRDDSTALLNEADCADIGYEPKRDDFEEEYANDAEKLLSTIRMRPGPEAQTADEVAFLQEVKLARLGTYNRVLERRRAAHAVAREHKMLEEFSSHLQTGTEGECYNVFCKNTFPTKEKEDEYRAVFCRMRQVATREELESLEEKIGKMETLKEDIIHLQALQRNGETEIKGRFRSDAVKSSANSPKDRK